MRSGRAPWSVEGVLELLERRSELQGLHLSGTTPDSDVGQLFAKREAGNLSSLSLTYNRLGEAALESLVRATHLEKLRELDLSYNHALTNDAAKRLVKAPQLQKLRRLGLRASSRIGVAAFTTARGFGDLEHLDLRDNSNPEKSAAIDKLRLRFGAAARIGYDSDV